MYQFSDKMDSFKYLGPNLPENGFCHRNFKNLIMNSKSTPPLYHVCQFSIKMDNIWFLDLDLGKLPNYVQYILVQILLRVLQRAGWMWMEVDAQFSNIL